MSLSVRQQCLNSVVALVLGFAAIAPAASQAKGLELGITGHVEKISDAIGGKTSGAAKQSDGKGSSIVDHVNRISDQIGGKKTGASHADQVKRATGAFGDDSDVAKQTDRVGKFDAKKNDDADRRADRLDRAAKPGDLKILDEKGRTAHLVYRGHDVVIDLPENRYAHYWIGNDGRIYWVVRDNNKGWAISFVNDGSGWKPLPPPPPKAKKRSFISLYDPETNKTYTRVWPAEGGVQNFVDDGDTRDTYDHP
jgi:hypothetical protein